MADKSDLAKCLSYPEIAKCFSFQASFIIFIASSV